MRLTIQKRRIISLMEHVVIITVWGQQNDISILLNDGSSLQYGTMVT